MTDNYTGTDSTDSDNNAAADLVRHKIDQLYNHEPSAKQEEKEVEALDKPLSKHQAYMNQISQSGMSLAEIQTAWHNYYLSLNDEAKHEVWQEFYAEHDRLRAKAIDQPKHNLRLPATNKPAVHHLEAKDEPSRTSGSRTIGQVKDQLLHKANLSSTKKLQAKQHFQSLLFGVGMGLIAVIILLFGFFNERFIAPFITPSKSVSNTPIIIDGATAVDNNPKIIIPKINVEIPVVYTEPSVAEKAVQKALENGVVHYATTPDPGQKGNAVIFGHSSNNILNHGRYKFAFVLLNKLKVGDTFFLDKDGVRYSYKIYERKIVEPSDVSVLGDNSKTATVTLITCDPPGTTRHRLIVVGEQITPSPTSNTASTATKADSQTKVLPSNAPSLWSRLVDWL